MRARKPATSMVAIAGRGRCVVFRRLGKTWEGRCGQAVGLHRGSTLQLMRPQPAIQMEQEWERTTASWGHVLWCLDFAPLAAFVQRVRAGRMRGTLSNFVWTRMSIHHAKPKWAHVAAHARDSSTPYPAVPLLALTGVIWANGSCEHTDRRRQERKWPPASGGLVLDLVGSSVCLACACTCVLPLAARFCYCTL